MLACLGNVLIPWRRMSKESPPAATENVDRPAAGSSGAPSDTPNVSPRAMQPSGAGSAAQPKAAASVESVFDDDWSIPEPSSPSEASKAVRKAESVHPPAAASHAASAPKAKAAAPPATPEPKPFAVAAPKPASAAVSKPVVRPITPSPSAARSASGSKGAAASPPKPAARGPATPSTASALVERPSAQVSAKRPGYGKAAVGGDSPDNAARIAQLPRPLAAPAKPHGPPLRVPVRAALESIDVEVDLGSEEIASEGAPAVPVAIVVPESAAKPPAPSLPIAIVAPESAPKPPAPAFPEAFAVPAAVVAATPRQLEVVSVDVASPQPPQPPERILVRPPPPAFVAAPECAVTAEAPPAAPLRPAPAPAAEASSDDFDDGAGGHSSSTVRPPARSGEGSGRRKTAHLVVGLAIAGCTLLILAAMILGRPSSPTPTPTAHSAAAAASTATPAPAASTAIALAPAPTASSPAETVPSAVPTAEGTQPQGAAAGELGAKPAFVPGPAARPRPFVKPKKKYDPTGI